MKLTSNILFLIIISCLGLKAQTEPSFNDFLKLFPGKLIPPEHLSKFLQIEGPFPEQRLQFEQRFAKKILEQTDIYILVSVNYSCGAGGMCESVDLYSFKLDGQLLSTLTYSEAYGDCGFRNTIKPLYFDDKKIVTKIHEWEGDCIEDSTRYELTRINEYQIQQDGQILKTQNQKIELRRRFHNASTEFLAESYLNKLSVDDLSTMRNEIFASRGYSFKSKKWSEYFKNTDWYVAENEIVEENQLTFVERKNLELIKEIENRKTPHNNGEHP